MKTTVICTLPELEISSPNHAEIPQQLESRVVVRFNSAAIIKRIMATFANWIDILIEHFVESNPQQVSTNS